nr:UDP-N-acetylmuramoyl-L-alanyl-D-glutamate--2,6-diaminopimelate ligase MurE homolog, chloroplastic [Tanacetum cinerariifolium]
LSWNNRKKSMSLGCKEMLLEKMKEIEAFNASRVSTKAKDYGEGSTSTQKEKRARCYICKTRGHDTPKGILEISSGLLRRQNIYNILAAVAVGIAVGAPLEDIVWGIEEVDVVPDRCELIDEEQTYGVVVDYANTPAGLSRLLDNVRELNPKRVITVIGCPGETDRGKRPDPLDILDDMLAGIGWTMQDYLKHQADDYHPPLPNGHRVFFQDIRRVVVRSAVSMGKEVDIV